MLRGALPELRQIDLGADAERVDGALQLVEIRRLAVPARLVFHERHALALDGVSEHGHRARRLPRRFERVDQRVDVVAVALEHVPAEGAVLVGERLNLHHLAHAPVDLEPVHVDDRHQPGETEVSRLHHGFPDLAFLVLAVAEDAEDAIRKMGEASRERLSDRDREPLPERSRGELDARQRQTVRVTLEGTAELAQRRDVLQVEVPGGTERHVERRRLVTGRPDHPIARRPAGHLGIVSQHVEVESRGDVHDRQRPAGVSRAGEVQGGERVTTHDLGRVGEALASRRADDPTRAGFDDGHAGPAGTSRSLGVRSDTGLHTTTGHRPCHPVDAAGDLPNGKARRRFRGSAAGPGAGGEREQPCHAVRAT